MDTLSLPPAVLPKTVEEILAACPGYILAETIDDLVALSTRDARDGWHDTVFDVPGHGRVIEARTCRVRNGIATNYVEPYMRRRDPDCMFIADDLPTDKPRFEERFGEDFDALREETIAWLKGQHLAVIFFAAGGEAQGLDAVALVPSNCGFFALGLAMLQGILDPHNLPPDFSPRAVIYVAPTFRHTRFNGRQVVVHRRSRELYEMFSYNLYPGPSAKKGVYGMLLDLGEREDWVTIHCSAVQVITPYDNKITISHEGASGSGKSEMLERMHREDDGRLLLGKNVVTGDKRFLVLPRGCALRPVVDDMALCHPTIQRDNDKLTILDAEQSWFLRVNHIRRYGTDPHLEASTIHAPGPLLFFNFEVAPGGTALIWDHIEDSPGKTCPNPRVVLPRSYVSDVVTGAVSVDIRSFGVRTPPCTKTAPTYGIMGLFHLLPASLAWLWRLVAPRGHDNPSITDSEGMSSEGVGSYWPFATGRRVDQANLLLQQILDTPKSRYILCPNQHVGAWSVGFMPEWVAREYLARRGTAGFPAEQIIPARSPLLGYIPRDIMVEGQTIPPWFFQVQNQTEVGVEAYDKGAEILHDFFERCLTEYLEDDLMPLAKQIIECCLSRGTIEDYASLIQSESWIAEE